MQPFSVPRKHRLAGVHNLGTRSPASKSNLWKSRANRSRTNYIRTHPFGILSGPEPLRGGDMNTAVNPVAPKRGDRVAMSMQEGVFEVADINSLMQTANLKSTDGQGHITRNVPWTSLKPLARK